MRAQRIGRVLRKVYEDKQELKQARAVVSEMEKIFGKNGKHWIQGQWDDNEGNYCLLGALATAVDKKDAEDVRELVHDAISAAIPGASVDLEKDEWTSELYIAPDKDIIEFNDYERREFSSIQNVLKRAKKAINWAIVGEGK